MSNFFVAKRYLVPGLLAVLGLLTLVASARAQSGPPMMPPTLALVPYDALTQARAQSLSFTPLALIPMDGGEWLLGEFAEPELAAQSQAEIGAVVVGQPDPAQGNLYLVELESEMGEGHDAPDPSTYGHVLWQSADYALVHMPPDQAELLSQSDVRLIALDAPLVEVQAATLPPAPTSSNPRIATLLPKITAADLRTWDQRLSGQEIVVIGGVARYLKSRYSWSTNGRRSEQYVYEQLRAMGYTPHYANYTTPYGHTWRNIVVDIPGRVDASQMVLVVGHLDSISFPTSGAGSNAPGADDNGSGSASLLAMAKLLKDEPLAYTLRLVWFTGEELGYWGSRPYVRSLASQGAKIVAAINLDMIGYDGNGDRVVELHTGTRAVNLTLGDHLAAANQLYSLGLTLERKSTTAAYFSDHRSFWESGYPSLLAIENFFDGTNEDPRPRDRNPAYHSTADRADIVDFNYVARIARMGMAAALQLAVPVDAQPPTPTPTPTPGPTTCSQRIVNGGFETDTAWSFGSTARKAAYSAAVAHTGARSVRTGIVSAANNAKAYSTAYQTVATPDDTALTLSFWVNGSGADANDYSEVLLLRLDNSVLKIVWRGRPANPGWTQRQFDISAYAGQSIVVYLNTYNDGAGGNAYAYFDDISLRACPPNAYIEASESSEDALIYLPMLQHAP